MFTLWYIYLGFQEFRRRGYFQWWVQWWKNQDNALALSPTPSSSSPTSDAISDTRKMDNIATSTEKNDLLKTVNADRNEAISAAEESRSNKPDTIVTPLVKPAPSSPIPAKVEKPNVYEKSDEIFKNTKHVPIKTDVVDPESLNSMEKNKFNESFVRAYEDDDVTDKYLLKGKDSKLFIAAEVSDEEKDLATDFSDPSKIFVKKKLFSQDDSRTGPDVRSNSVQTGSERREIDGAMASGGRGHGLREGSDELYRLTRSDYPDVPAGTNTGTRNDNITLMSDRTSDSTDSILRDSDDFIMNERKIAPQTSLSKKAFLSKDPPTIYTRVTAPSGESKIKSNVNPESHQSEVLAREAELKFAAAEALKESQRKKIEMDSVDDEETIVFGDSDNPDSDSGNLLDISDEDEETADNRLSVKQ